jgi:hypothetical protein
MSSVLLVLFCDSSSHAQLLLPVYTRFNLRDLFFSPLAEEDIKFLVVGFHGRQLHQLFKKLLKLLYKRVSFHIIQDRISKLNFCVDHLLYRTGFQSKKLKKPSQIEIGRFEPVSVFFSKINFGLVVFFLLKPNRIKNDHPYRI